MHFFRTAIKQRHCIAVEKARIFSTVYKGLQRGENLYHGLQGFANRSFKRKKFDVDLIRCKSSHIRCVTQLNPVWLSPGRSCGNSSHIRFFVARILTVLFLQTVSAEHTWAITFYNVRQLLHNILLNVNLQVVFYNKISQL